MTGLKRCASVWACPVCAASIQAQRADELVQALEAHHAQGGEVALLTLTMRHNARQSLAMLWDVLSPAFDQAWAQNRAARDAKAAAGVAGLVRTVEATHGRNGWHLHIHALVFFKPGADLGEPLDRLEEVIAGGWARAITRRGLQAPSRAHGCDLRLLDLTAARHEVGRYISKAIASERSAAAELTGSQTKFAGAGNRTPWQILEAAIAGDRRARMLWGEWEIASHGRRCHNWSRGLRDELGLGAEPTDTDLATEPTAPDEKPTPLLRFNPAAWDHWIKPHGYIHRKLITAANDADTPAAITALAGLPTRPPADAQIHRWNTRHQTWEPIPLSRLLARSQGEQEARPDHTRYEARRLGVVRPGAAEIPTKHGPTGGAGYSRR